MSEMHSSPDRVVWFDLPVGDLERASRFYAAVLGIRVSRENGGNFTFAVLEHGGLVLKAIESIAPHGFRAIVLDNEGNRIALHSAAADK